LRAKKLDFMVALFSATAIITFTLTLSTGESFSLSDLDRDHDGVLGEFDECPQLPETYNKFQDSDGCPDSVFEDITPYQFPDIDGDGIEDRLDSCIYIPEIFNDYLDFDGCPEIIPNRSDIVEDSDLDTIPDSLDACPYEKEIFNEFKDGDGCPDSWNLSAGDDSKIPVVVDNQCRSGKVQVLRANTNDFICVSEETAKKWESYGIVTIIAIPSVEPITDPVVLPLIPDEEIILPENVLEFNLTEIIQKTDYSFSTRSDKEKRNIEKIITFFNSLNPWDGKTISELMADEYVEHNPTMPGDKAGVLEKSHQTYSEIPSNMTDFDLKRIYADDDYVLTHSHFQSMTRPDASIIDIFKMNDDGQIIEHWDVMQEIPYTSLNNNTMFYLD